MRKKIVTAGLAAAICLTGCTAALPASTPSSQTQQEVSDMTKTTLSPLPDGAAEIYFAGGCFWGIEKLYQSIDGVLDAQSGYANGSAEIVPDYETVCRGDTGYRETVRVVYDPGKVSLDQLMKAFFYVIDPTVEKRQGNDVGDQYQTGIYFADEAAQKTVEDYTAKEREKHDVFAVEVAPLSSFFPAEEYHQDYLDKNPNGYCHIPVQAFRDINGIISEKEDAAAQSRWEKPSRDILRENLSDLQYEVTQNGATERAFTGEYWNFDEKGIYVDITTGQPLFSSLDKFQSSCGWPSFSAPIDKDSVTLHEDLSYGMNRTEVKSEAGDAHLGHVFYGEPESPNGVRYCINSASLRFIPYDEMQAQGYGEWLSLFDAE